ncbi:hypothetical protein [Fluviicola sp.]|uniref:hypothetical protein n=1 Tax=Fluviicola sp. TaxID=1917219 RepID=UPI002636AA78|nr:hypothetical protein [Fluviicola sp.]
MKELDEIDQLFQTTFEGFELTPDPSVKAHIDRAIASKKKRRRFLFILFPVLLGTALAASLYFYAPSGKAISNNQHISQDSSSGKPAIASNNTIKKSNTDITLLTDSLEKTPSIHYLHSKKEISGRKNALLRPEFSDWSKKNSRASSGSGSKQGFSEGRRNSAILRPDQSRTNLHLSTTTDTTLSQTLTDSDQTKNQSDPGESLEIAKANKQDSTTSASDSTNTETQASSSETISKPLEIATKKSNNWSLSILAGWEGEKKRPFESFDTTDFAGKRKEFANIHSSSFYGKIELNRRLTHRLGALIGLGFRSSNITQYGSLYTRDSVIVFEGVGSAPSDSVTYFINHRAGTQTYQVNSIIVPLGLSFSIPLSKQFQFRLSGGTEFAYGWMTTKQKQPGFSAPNFRSFGWNFWLRPEFHYTFGNYQLFGFGSFNQALSQQLKWDFTTRRNPAFGAGIGLLIQL